MNKKLVLLSLMVAGCGNQEENTLQVRPATAAECPSGGTALVENGTNTFPVCDGETGPAGAIGRTGANGAPGDVGPQGSTGGNGAPGAAGLNGKDAEDFQALSNLIAPFAESLVGIGCCNTDFSVCSGGSGVKLASDRVYTAKHVIANMSSCSIFDGQDSHLLSTSAVFFVFTDDLAYIQVTVPGPVVPLLSKYSPTLGEPLVVVGQPGEFGIQAFENQYTFGHVTATDLSLTFAAVSIVDWPRAFSTDAVAFHGNSGGAVFNKTGVAVGLLVGGFNGADTNTGPDTSIVLPF